MDNDEKLDKLPPRSIIPKTLPDDDTSETVVSSPTVTNLISKEASVNVTNLASEITVENLTTEAPLATAANVTSETDSTTALTSEIGSKPVTPSLSLPSYQLSLRPLIPKSAANRRRKLNDVFINVIIICLCLELVLIIAISEYVYNNQRIRDFCQNESNNCEESCETKPKQFICNSLDCLKSAALLLDNVNNNVDPCQNFHQFACGKFIQKHPTDILPFISPLHIMKSKAHIVIHSFLVETEAKNLPQFLKKLQTAYKGCVIELTSNTNTAAQYLRNVLTNLSGWPVIIGKQWNETNFSITDTLIQLTKMGLGRSQFFHMEVNFNFPNNTENVIWLKIPKFIFNDKSIYSEITMKQNEETYVRHMYRALVKLQLNLPTEQNKEELREVFKFEVSLFKITRVVSYNLRTVEELQEILPQIHWKKYFRKLIDPTIDDHELVFIPSFLNDFSKLLKNTSSRTIGNYLLVKAASEFDSITHAGPLDCLAILLKFLPVAVASAYIRARSFTDDFRISTSRIVHYIRKRIIKDLNNIKWMTHETRRLAIEKINKTISVFPFVTELLNDTMLNNYYSKLNILGTSFFMDYLNMKIWRTLFEFEQLKTSRENWRWHVHYKLTETQNIINLNSIEIGIEMLQHPIFHENRPSSMNYGSIGFIIGHEFTHGMIPPGHMYDSEGHKNYWWDRITMVLYDVRSECLIKQYSDFVLPDTQDHIDGDLTLIENFADNVGLKTAYDAYLAYAKENGTEYRLPGINYTSRQLFWLSFANTWCSNHRISHLKLLLKDVHSPNMFRILGSLSNMKEFAKDFNCPSRTGMNPEKKCYVI